jgi:hypothetical protein
MSFQRGQLLSDVRQLDEDFQTIAGDADYHAGFSARSGASTPRELIIQDLEQVDRDINERLLAREAALYQQSARSARRPQTMRVMETGTYYPEEEPVYYQKPVAMKQKKMGKRVSGVEAAELRRDFGLAKAKAQKKVLRRNQVIDTIVSGAVTGGLWAVNPALGLAGAAATPVIMERFLPTRPNESWPLTLGQAALGATGATIGAALVPGAAPIGAAVGELVGAGFGSNLGDTRLGQSHTKTDFGVKNRDVAVGAIKNHKRRVAAINKQWLEIQAAQAKLERMQARLLQKAQAYGLRYVA